MLYFYNNYYENQREYADRRPPNEMTGDFEIGILANIFATANQPLTPGKNELRWVLLDGDIDPIWIENMNSVMDDSKCLTLENKDRILMQKFCSLLLESSNIITSLC